MPRPRSSVVKPVKAKLADGRSVTYYYDRATGKSLGTDYEAAVARATASQAAGPKLAHGTVAALVAEYKASSAFRRKIKPGTRVLYGRYLDQIRSGFGDFSIRSITPSMIRDVREALQDQPSKANMTLALWSILMKLAVLRGYIATNPAVSPGRMATPKRDQIWSTTDEDEFLARARPSLKLGFLLFLYTVQRPNDCLAMTKGQVTERSGRLFLRLRQQKTDELLDVPVHRRLEPYVRERLAERDSAVLLVPSPTGRRWLYRNFARAWDKIVYAIEMERRKTLAGQGWSQGQIDQEMAAGHVQRRDLRRTGVVRMAEAGATTPQIAAISGHSIDYCQRIIDTYLPRRTEVAIGGMELWEGSASKPEKVTRLSDVSRSKGS